MQLRPRNKEETQISFKRPSTSLNEKPVSEPIPASAPMVMPPLKKTKSEEDIDDIKRDYADNPQALAALEEHFRGLKSSDESGMLGNRTENINYSSFFFRKDVIDNFTKSLMNTVPADKKSTFPLSNFYLYNSDDILENISQRGTFKTRFTEQSPEYQQLKNKNMDKLIKFLSSKICEDIGSDYAKTAVERAISLTEKNNIFDIVVISNKNIEAIGLIEEEEEEAQDMDNDEEEDESSMEEEEYKPKKEPSFDKIDEILAYRLQGVVGFIIVELGECKQYPFGYSINLICTNKKAPAGCGSILMGLYLYTILSHPDKNDSTTITFPTGNAVLNIIEKPRSNEAIGDVTIEVTFSSDEPLTQVQQYGILELASAYTNPGGLCMYEKFGFQYTESMYGEDCFPDFNNLPMIIDFNTKPGYSELSKEQRKEKVINITAGTDRGFPKSKICNVRDSFTTPAGKVVKTGEQKLLGYLKTLKLLMEHDMSRVTGADAEMPIENLYNTIKFINEPRSRTPYEERPEPANPGNIDDYINYLETPQADRTQPLDLTKLLQQIPVSKGGATKKRRNKKINGKTTRKKYPRKKYPRKKHPRKTNHRKSHKKSTHGKKTHKKK
jgi:hypothetical protein